MEIEIYLKGLSREERKNQNQSMLVKDLLKAYCLKRKQTKNVLINNLSLLY